MFPVDPTLAFETDGTFGGLLGGYAEAHRRRALPAEVREVGAPASGSLFGETVRIEAEPDLVARIERGLERETTGLVGRLRRAFLSERPGMEVDVLRLVDAVAHRGGSATEDWTYGPAREVARWSGRVGREAHRMEAFVRFERLDTEADGPEAYVATIRPEYHVLPILPAHFEARYPTLAWRIVDARRGLALVHTPASVRDADAPAVRLVPAETLDASEHASEETAYQTMWRAYFQAVTIPERRNLALHLRHVPKRYWPYLTEKRAAV